MFAGRVHALEAAPDADTGVITTDEDATAREVERREPSVLRTTSTETAAKTNSNEAALQLLALLQREGRLIDFLQQDVTAFADADIGAAARVVHDGCRKALAAHLEIRPVRSEREGGAVTLDAVDPNAVKLVEGYDPNVLAPAEVEL